MGAQSEGATALPRRVQRAASCALLGRACVVGAAHAISMEGNEGTPIRATPPGGSSFRAERVQRRLHACIRAASGHAIEPSRSVTAC